MKPPAKKPTLLEQFTRLWLEHHFPSEKAPQPEPQPLEYPEWWKEIDRELGIQTPA